MLQNLVNEIGNQAVRDGMFGILESKAKPKTIAFFTKTNLLKYPGYEQAKINIADKNRAESEKNKK